MSQLFNFRVDDDLNTAIEEAADGAGIKKSVWAREVLGAVALGGVTLVQLADLIEGNGTGALSPHPARFLTLQGQTGRRYATEQACLHPVTAYKRLPFTVICGLCGGVVKRT